MSDSYILAIETSARAGSAAIGLGDKLLGQIEFTAGARHGVELLPSVDRLLAEAGITPEQIEVICVSAGPGSFTGLRVGFTFARILAQLNNAKLIAVPSTRVIVENLRFAFKKENGPIYIAPVLDAKRGQVYSAGFIWENGELKQILDECVLTPADLIERLSLGGPIWITGEGVGYHLGGFENQSNVVLMDKANWACRAEFVLKLGTQMLAEGRFTDRDKLSPIYVRLPEAEERWLARQAN